MQLNVKSLLILLSFVHNLAMESLLYRTVGKRHGPEMAGETGNAATTFIDASG